MASPTSPSAVMVDLPVEVWQHVCDQITDHYTMLDASLVCHCWRAALFPCLFASITLLAEGGPWKEVEHNVDSAFETIIPLVREVTITALNETDAPVAWTAARLVPSEDVDRMNAVIATFPNLKTIIFDTVRILSLGILYSSFFQAHVKPRELRLINVEFEWPQWADESLVPAMPHLLTLVISGSTQIARILATISQDDAMDSFQHLKVVFSQRDHLAWSFNALCGYVNSLRCALLDLAIDFSSMPGTPINHYGSRLQNTTVKRLALLAESDSAFCDLEETLANALMPAVELVTIDIKVDQMVLLPDCDPSLKPRVDDTPSLRTSFPAVSQAYVTFYSCMSFDEGRQGMLRASITLIRQAMVLGLDLQCAFMVTSPSH